MPVTSEIVRRRRRREERRTSLARLGNASAGVVALLVGVVGLLVISGARIFVDQVGGLPPVERIEAYFGAAGAQGFSPTRVYARDGKTLLLEFQHTEAEGRRWLSLDPASPGALSQTLLQAVILANEPSFWTNPGYDPQGLVPSLLSGGEGRAGLSIAQQLVDSTLLAGRQTTGGVRRLQSAALAAELARRYPKEQILVWYLNSAHYGRHAFGMDAAALVYFNRHASDLELPEIAMLAQLPQQPDSNPIDDPDGAKRLQRETLDLLVEAGAITQAEADRAAAAPLRLNPLARQDATRSSLAQFVMAQLEGVLGPGVSSLGGLTITTTLDPDLQSQAACTAATHLSRLQGGDPAGVKPTAGGELCLAASLLPALRPRDAGVDHAVSGAAVVVLDPTSGEVLAMADLSAPGADPPPLLSPAPAGTALYPFIYLTAFAQGYTPGTMTLDVPQGSEMAPDEAKLGDFRGPVRMRTALTNAYPAATERTLALVGAENVLRTASQMGLLTSGQAPATGEPDPASGLGRASLMELAQAYGVIAHRGRLLGLSRVETPRSSATTLEPAILLRVTAPSGREISAPEPGMRVVLSPQLAYMMAHVLSDETARAVSYGPSGPLDVGRPAGALVGEAPSAEGNWTIGFTPSRVVAVWVGNADGRPMIDIDRTNGAAPIWHAVLRYATRDLPPAGWDLPPGVNMVEVCDPSGLLPTPYCPRLAKEVYIQGTEPTAYDDLYRPFRVNRETGKLATLFTPLELVEERIYLVVPPEAAAWALASGIERPPDEYDLVHVRPDLNPDVQITSPDPFETVRGDVRVLGSATPVDLSFYRLQVGEGLNPTRWIQIGGDVASTVVDGELGVWDTRDLNGLFILQLVVVLADGRLHTSAVPLTVDNLAPEVRIVRPQPGDRVSRAGGTPVLFEIEAGDARGVARVEIYVNGRLTARLDLPPYVLAWTPGAEGTYEILARAFDDAGNVAQAAPVVIEVIP